MERIIRAASRGKVCEELLYVDPDSGERIEKKKIFLFSGPKPERSCPGGEMIDPIRIYHYIENDGYTALAALLAKNDPAWAREEVKASGLRGRGGAGFPTGLKWEFARQTDSDEKFVMAEVNESGFRQCPWILKVNWIRHRTDELVETSFTWCDQACEIRFPTGTASAATTTASATAASCITTSGDVAATSGGRTIVARTTRGQHHALVRCIQGGIWTGKLNESRCVFRLACSKCCNEQ